jgi:transcriptional regulator with XRE-family HTH domain
MTVELTLGSAIRRLRQASGFSQKEFAERLAVTAPYLSRVEAGRKEPSVQLLKKIAHELEIPPGLLLAVALWADMPANQKHDYSEVLEELVEFGRVTQLQLFLRK